MYQTAKDTRMYDNVFQGPTSLHFNWILDLGNIFFNWNMFLSVGCDWDIN